MRSRDEARKTEHERAQEQVAVLQAELKAAQDESSTLVGELFAARLAAGLSTKEKR